MPPTPDLLIFLSFTRQTGKAEGVVLNALVCLLMIVWCDNVWSYGLSHASFRLLIRHPMLS